MSSSPLPLDVMVRPCVAADYVKVSRQLLWWWCRVGKLQRDEHGRVRLGDVLRVESQTRRSPHSRRVA